MSTFNPPLFIDATIVIYRQGGEWIDQKDILMKYNRQAHQYEFCHPVFFENLPSHVVWNIGDIVGIKMSTDVFTATKKGRLDFGYSEKYVCGEVIAAKIVKSNEEAKNGTA